MYLSVDSWSFVKRYLSSFRKFETSASRFSTESEVYSSAALTQSLNGMLQKAAQIFLSMHSAMLGAFNEAIVLRGLHSSFQLIIDAERTWLRFRNSSFRRLKPSIQVRELSIASQGLSDKQKSGNCWLWWKTKKQTSWRSLKSSLVNKIFSTSFFHHRENNWASYWSCSDEIVEWQHVLSKSSVDRVTKLSLNRCVIIYWKKITNKVMRKGLSWYNLFLAK